MAKTKKKNKGGGGTKKKAKAGNKMKRFQAGGGGGGSDSSNVKVDNPFEIRMHRTKHDNLGRRGRHERGLPGVSRSKAVEKRRETLLKEYKVRNKSNVLVDKRIGEKIKNMSEEEKIVRRSVMEKKRQYKQKSIFNLPSTDDILTHKGQMLMDIDRYEDPRDESDSEDERLNEEFVSDANFAGGFLKVKEKTDDEAGGDDAEKSRKDIIAELILSSKKRKMEKAKEADENYELVTKLDEEFKTPDFRSLLTFVGGKDKSKEPAEPKKEDYDKIVRELHFETKTGQASNRLKTEDEIQEEELKKLQKLEKDRLRRMKAQDPTAVTHRSADELADGFEVDEDIPVLSYKEDGRLKKTSENDQSSEEEEYDESAEQDQSGSEDESEDDSDAFSDLLTDDEDVIPGQIKKKTKSPKAKELVDDDQSLIAELTDDIPYVLNLPKSYEAYKKLMKKYQAHVLDSELCVIRFKSVTEKLVKYSLLADKNGLPSLFVYLLRFVAEGIETSKLLSENLERIVDVAVFHLHTVLLSNPSKCVELMENDTSLKSLISVKNNKPTIVKVVLYQIFSKIFCVTDFCHRVLSPIRVNILDVINSYSGNTFMGLLKVLALVDVMYESSKDSRRYSPEILKLLFDILEAVSLPLSKLRFRRRRFDFLRINPSETKSLEMEDNFNPYLTEAEDVAPTSSQIFFVLLRVFILINKFIECQLKTRPFNNLIFKAIKVEDAVLKLNWANVDFHKSLFSNKLSSSVISSQDEGIDDEIHSAPIDRPKMLKLYEPQIEEYFDGNRKRKLKRKGLTQEEARLSHKVKKEMKSAVREIIKDNAFLAKEQMKEQAMKDAERNRRVKELLGSLSNQEGDYRKLKKQK